MDITYTAFALFVRGSANLTVVYNGCTFQTMKKLFLPPALRNDFREGMERI